MLNRTPKAIAAIVGLVVRMTYRLPGQHVEKCWETVGYYRSEDIQWCPGEQMVLPPRPRVTRVPNDLRTLAAPAGALKPPSCPTLCPTVPIDPPASPVLQRHRRHPSSTEGGTGGHRCAAGVSMGSRVNTVKREGFHSVHARVSKSKLALSSGVLEGLG